MSLVTSQQGIDVTAPSVNRAFEAFTCASHGLKCAFVTFSRRVYFSKPRMYGMTGGRGPVLKSGPRVER